MQLNAAYKDKVKTQLHQMDAQLEKLRARMEAVDAERRVRFERYLETLDEKRDELGTKLESLEESSGEALDDLKTGLKDAWQRLAIAIRAADARFH